MNTENVTKKELQDELKRIFTKDLEQQVILLDKESTQLS